jgi:lipoprotein-anchoring transpeptidase ErfK/SrfK
MLLAVPLLATACGTTHRAATVEVARTTPRPAAKACSSAVTPLGSARRAYVGFAPHGAVALRKPGGRVLARFGPKNVNDYPTAFGIVGVVHARDCAPLWYRVQVPIRPNGITGYVPARTLQLTRISSRIVVDLSTRRLTASEGGRVRLAATVAVGSAATPTPTGRFYVNQRLVPGDPSGPFGPGAIGISAFSDVLTGWTQGGPIAIHGTNAPWSIGQAVSNGCIRLTNAVLRAVFRLAVAGTPVIIRA